MCADFSQLRAFFTVQVQYLQFSFLKKEKKGSLFYLVGWLVGWLWLFNMLFLKGRLMETKENYGFPTHPKITKISLRECLPARLKQGGHYSNRTTGV